MTGDPTPAFGFAGARRQLVQPIWPRAAFAPEHPAGMPWEADAFGTAFDSTRFAVPRSSSLGLWCLVVDSPPPLRRLRIRADDLGPL